jgi:putative endonuclease
MSKYIQQIAQERLKEKKVQLYEALSMAFLDNEYESDDYTDDDRVYLIVQLLQSIRDTTFDGFFHEDDLRLITHYFTDKWHAKNKLQKGLDEMKRVRENTIKKWESLNFLDGLSGYTKNNIAHLYESEASLLLQEPRTDKIPIMPIVKRVLDLIPVGHPIVAITEPNPWYVYMVECSDGTLYTGISNNVSKRILAHNSGKGAKYTKARLPVTLKWSQSCENRSEASKEEYKIKKLSRKQKLTLIKGE